ncbi:MAG TPA: hypothetical protein VME86_03715 [Acidobacteriaceae bacterium]|nr:hypothetical protein [Acidobacteriaceae bacterium]
MRLLALLCLSFIAGCPFCVAQNCVTIHGRAHYYAGDGQLRIWQIGTHHEFEPDKTSWDRVMKWLEAGVPPSEKKSYPPPATFVDLYADFRVCPTGTFKKGSVQQAKILTATHRRYVSDFPPQKQ